MPRGSCICIGAACGLRADRPGGRSGNSGSSSSTWSAQLAAEAAARRLSSQFARSSRCAPAPAVTGAGALTRGWSCGSVARARPALSPPPAAFLGLAGSFLGLADSFLGLAGAARGGAATRTSMLLPPLGAAALFNAVAGWLAATCCGCGLCTRCLDRSFFARHLARLVSTCASCRREAAGRVRCGCCAHDRHTGRRFTEALRFSCSGICRGARTGTCRSPRPTILSRSPRGNLKVYSRCPARHSPRLRWFYTVFHVDSGSSSPAQTSLEPQVCGRQRYATPVRKRPGPCCRTRTSRATRR